MLNSMVMIIFSGFDGKSFLGKFILKDRNALFKRKLSILQVQVFFFWPDILFLEKFDPKNQKHCFFRMNVVTRLIQISVSDSDVKK